MKLLIFSAILILLIAILIINENKPTPNYEIDEKSENLTKFTEEYNTSTEEIKKTPSLFFNYQCYNEIENIRPSTIEKSNTKYETVFIDFRILPHVKYIISNVLIKLPNWDHTVICGSVNYEFMKNMCNDISKNIKVINLEININNSLEYSNLLKTKYFWNNMTGEKILLYQSDSFLFNYNIYNFLKYDYIGALSYNCFNGGFSLRTKKVLLDVIEKNKSLPEYAIEKNKSLPEDLFFSRCIKKYDIGVLPSKSVSKQFGEENYKNNNSLSGHTFWFSNPDRVSNFVEDNLIYQKYLMNLENPIKPIEFEIKNSIFNKNKNILNFYVPDITKFDFDLNKLKENFRIIITYYTGEISEELKNHAEILKINKRGREVGNNFTLIEYLKKFSRGYSRITFFHTSDKRFLEKLKKYSLKDDFEIFYFIKELSGDGISKYLNSLKKVFWIDNKEKSIRYMDSRFYIIESKLAEKLYGDKYLYNLLNTEKSFDYLWTKNRYNSNENYNDLYERSLKENLETNQYQIKEENLETNQYQIKEENLETNQYQIKEENLETNQYQIKEENLETNQYQIKEENLETNQYNFDFCWYSLPLEIASKVKKDIPLPRDDLDEALFHKYTLGTRDPLEEINYKIIKEIEIYKKYICVIHCYDLKFFKQYFNEYIDDILKIFSVIVTYSLGNIKELEDYNFTILKIKNRGMDIGSKFVSNLYLKENNIDFHYIFTIHSKNCDNTRKKYINFFIKNLDKISEFMEKDKFIGGFFPNLLHLKNRNNKNNIYVDRMEKYLNMDNVSYQFPEGNFYILNKNVFNHLYSDKKLYNILNDKLSFDFNWVNKYYNKNFNVKDCYKYYIDNKLFPNNLSFKKDKGFDKNSLRDSMIEHSYERLVLSSCISKKLTIKILTDNSIVDHKKEIVTIIACHTNSEIKIKAILNNIKYLEKLSNRIFIVNSKEFNGIIEKKIDTVKYIINDNLTDEQAKNLTDSHLDLSNYSIKEVKEHYKKFGFKEGRTIIGYCNLTFEYQENSHLLCQGKWYNSLKEKIKDKYYILTNDSFFILRELRDFEAIFKNNEMVSILDSNEIKNHYPDFLRYYDPKGIEKWINFYEKNHYKCKSYSDVVNRLEIETTYITEKRDCLYKMSKNFSGNVHFSDSINKKYLDDFGYPIIKIKKILKNMYNGFPKDFDPVSYKKINIDLAGFSDKETITHFKENGMKEGRLYKKNQKINTQKYLIKYLQKLGIKTKVGISISTYSNDETPKERYKIIVKCLDSILENVYNKNIYINIVSDTVTSEHMKILKKYPFKLIINKENMGISYTKNVGIKTILDNGCEYVFLLDDDIIVKDVGFIEKYTDAMDRTNIGHFSYFANISDKENKRIILKGIDLVKTSGLDGVILTFTKKCIEKVGFFDNFPGKYGYEHIHFTNKCIHYKTTPGWVDVLEANKFIDGTYCTEFPSIKETKYFDKEKLKQNSKIESRKNYKKILFDIDFSITSL